MPVFSDYLLRSTPVVVLQGLYVRLVNNATSVAYVSDAAADTNGKYTFSGAIPIPGTYTVSTSPTGSPPWTATGDTNYVVPYTDGEKLLDAGGAVVNVARAKYNVGSLSSAAINTAGIAAAIADAGPSGVLLFPSSLGTVLHNGLTANQAGQHWIVEPGCTLKLANGANVDSVSVTVAAVLLDGGGALDGNGANNTGSGGLGRGIVCSADGLVVDLLTIQNTWGYSIQVAANKPKITRNTITNPGAGGNGTIGIFVQAVTQDQSAPTIALNDVTVTLNGVQGISCHGTTSTWNLHRVRILGNTVTMPTTVTTAPAIEVWGGCPRASVTANTVLGGGIGISVDHSNSSAVGLNTVFSSVNYGIEVASSTHCAVGSNTVDGNGVTLQGIILDGTASSYASLEGNDVLSCTSYGIHVQGAALHTNIVGGTVALSSGGPNPIYIQGASNNATVKGVHLIGGGGGSNYGVVFDASTGGLVQGCTFDGFATAAVAGYSAGAFVIDKLTVGPNHLVTAMAELALAGAATFGANVRVIRGTVAPAGVAAITVTASPFTYTNNDLVPEAIYIDAGTVSAIAKNAITVFTSTGKTVWLEPGEACTVTYSVLPTMNKDRK